MSQSTDSAKSENPTQPGTLAAAAHAPEQRSKPQHSSPLTAQSPEHAQSHDHALSHEHALTPEQGTSEPPRRNFLMAAVATLFGLILGLMPLVSGLWVFADPLRKRQAGGKFVRVTTFDIIGARPQLFKILQDRVDARNLYPNEPVGAVYIRRLPDSEQLQVLHATCPHAGCAVGFAAESNKFLCPCHNSAFEVDGTMIQPCASPRNLDHLNWKLVETAGVKEVWVEFMNFYTGRAEQQVKT